VRSARWLLAAAIILSGIALLVRYDTRRQPEPVRFTPLAVPAFDAGGTLTDAWADYDGDGDPDRFVGFNGEPSRLYRNDGNGSFTDVASQVGLQVARQVRTAAWGDFDADGDPDLFLGFAGDAPVTALWRNDGPEGFREIAAGAGLALDSGVTRQASWVDYDNDGDLDLFLALRDGPNRLWRNDAGTFVDVTGESGLGDPRRSVGAVWLDVDGDGDLDVYVANMDGDANGMWLNDRGHFSDVAEAWGLADGGRALGDEAQGTVRPCAVDYDNDGDFDLSTANYGANGLFLNPGTPGRWQNVAAAEGVAKESHYDSCLWGDFDNDGLADLFVNGTVTGGVQYRDWLLRREGGRFVDVTPEAILSVAADHGATWVDYDLDGDLDLSLTGAGKDGMHHLLQNLLRPELAADAVEVRVLDALGHATRPGAEVRVYATGTTHLLGAGLVDTGSGYDAQSDLPVHVGLPGPQPVDIVITVLTAGGRRDARVDGVDPVAQRGRVLAVRVDAQGLVVK
jgi:FG-GAP-like repeat